MDLLPLISVIVPVYNAEQYLNQCLDSLLNQTYSNLEVICINDGSKDLSLNILNEYKKTNSNIKIIDQINSGAAAARNNGIDVACGEFIMFVDSDDWLELSACEEAYQALSKHQADICMFTYVREFGHASKIKSIYNDTELYFDDIQCKEQLCKRVLGLTGQELTHPENADAISPLCIKLYKTSLIKEHNLRVVDTSVVCTCEDGLFNVAAFYYANAAVYINRPLYHYRKTNATSITTGYKKNLFNGWQRLFDLMHKFIEEHKCCKSYETALNNRIALSIIGLGLNILATDESSWEKIHLLKTILRQERYVKAYKQLTYQYFPIHWWVFFIFAKYRFAAGIYVLLVLMKKIINK